MAEYLTRYLGDLSTWPVLLMILAITTMMIFLTEFTSNTASTQMMLPVLAQVAIAQAQPPLLLMIPAAVAASMAFMMPVATPPNAIVFGSERLRVIDMARPGLVLNLIMSPVICALTLLFMHDGNFP
ncbi:MAG: anion permease [Leptospiraceae bacterium]|nr:anion permease [Leptospiraceae bacterium]